MPKLSIIIPTFNSGAVLDRALDSIVSQTFSDWEVLIMDGASTDDTIETAKFYNDSRIRIFSEPDKGIYDAMNKGIKKANAKWLYFLGSDDWLLNDSVLQQIFLANIDDYDVVYGDVEADNLGEEWRGEWDYHNILYNRCHQAVFYQKKIFKRVGKYPIKYRLAADHYINIRCLLDRKIKMCFLPVTVAHFSEGGFSYNYHDYAFDKDRNWIIILHGYTILPNDQILSHCRAALSCKPTAFRRIIIYFIAGTVLLFKPNR